jgi:hypothetical protein
MVRPDRISLQKSHRGACPWGYLKAGYFWQIESLKKGKRKK